MMLTALLFVLAWTGASTSPAGALSHVQNKLGIDLLKQLSLSGSNTFFSASSISSALSMVYVGAAGPTETELFSLLGYDRAGFRSREETLLALRELNQKAVQNQSVTLETASMVVTSNAHPVLASYVGEMKAIFDAEVKEVDFVNDGGKVIEEANRWVCEKTRGKITSVIDAVPSDVKMLLLNAIYFKGKWRHQFDKRKTMKRPFYNDGKLEVLLDTMKLNARLPYSRSDALEAEVIKVPYAGTGYSAVIMLPVRREAISPFVQKLSVDAFREVTSNLHTTEIDLQLPRFKMESEYKLKPVLKKMGLDSLFSSRSNLSRIDGSEDLNVSEVFHKAYLKIDEDGTEAAAVTAVRIKMKSLRQTTVAVRIDHPFVFCILSERSGEIMFLAAVNRL